MTCTLTDLATAVCVDEQDVAYLISEYLGIDLHEDLIPAEIVGEVHDVLQPWCERSVPECYPDLLFDPPARDGLCRCAAGMGGREHRKGPGCT